MVSTQRPEFSGNEHLKDEVLNQLGYEGNIAQFVSFSPELVRRYSWIAGQAPNRASGTPADAIACLLRASPEGAVNIRTFAPTREKSLDFIYGIRNAREAYDRVSALSRSGLYTIVNETVDVHDGGVSGVAYGGIVECAPGKTPRCVEGGGCASFGETLARSVLGTIFGFPFDVPTQPQRRIEFSIHPRKRGYRHLHTIIWESEIVGPLSLEARVFWPNDLSRLIGDKAYGLAVADAIGLPVPYSRVIPRAIPDFCFGRATRTGTRWLRTCPKEQVPGKYSTVPRWADPFRIMQSEDPTGTAIASIISQDGIEAQFSGALLTAADGSLVIEGVAGSGVQFMQGSARPERLPPTVLTAVRDLYAMAKQVLGPVRMEWVFDGALAWVVQLHSGTSLTHGNDIVPGTPAQWRELPVAAGLPALRDLVAEIAGHDIGIVLKGEVGMTSHMADHLRKACVPSRLEP